MSFRIMRYKDGKPTTPLKLSIWDAISNVPRPKPKPPKPCPCCKQVHLSHELKPNLFGRNLKRDSRLLSGTVEKTVKQGVQQPPAVDKAAVQEPRSSTPIETYSDEDNAKIIEMKSAQKSWKDILAAIGKESLQQLKEHWKVINPKNGGGGGLGRSERPLKNEEQKAAEIEEKKAKGRATKQTEWEGHNQTQNKPAQDQQKGDSAEMRSFADTYDRHKWMAAASRHFDLTGKRISPATARMMAEEK